MAMNNQLWGETLSCTFAINMHQVNVRRNSSSAALASYATWENLKVQSMKPLKLLSWIRPSRNSMYIRFSKSPIHNKKCRLSTTIMIMLKPFYSKFQLIIPSQPMDTGRSSWGWVTDSSIWLEEYRKLISSLRSLRRPQNRSWLWSA